VRRSRRTRGRHNVGFFLETLFGGLMVGMLYALVALGFVLIIRATNVVNFAQGDFAMLGGYAMVLFLQSGLFGTFTALNFLLNSQNRNQWKKFNAVNVPNRPDCRNKTSAK